MSDVALRIKQIYAKKEAALYALSLAYSAEALRLFNSRQANDQYWNNQTSDAKARMFANAFKTNDSIGWFMAHGIPYGVYLELANDRQNAVILPIIKELLPAYKKGIAKIYGSGS